MSIRRMVRIMPWNQIHMNKMQTAVTNIYFEMKKKKKKRDFFASCSWWNWNGPSQSRIRR